MGEVPELAVVGYLPFDVLDVFLGNLPGRVCANASQMYSVNLGSLVEHYWDKDAKAFKLNLDDDILKGCVITHGGELRNETIKGIRAKA